MDGMPVWARWAFVAAVLAPVGWLVWAMSGPGPLAVATWRLDGPASPTSTELLLLVEERGCGSGRGADGRIRTAVDYGQDEVRVTVWVRELRGDQTCQGVPPTPYVLRLTEPLGDRELRDGAAPATAVPEPDVVALRLLVAGRGDGTSASSYAPVERRLEAGTPLQQAGFLLSELAAGPTVEERARGFLPTAWPQTSSLYRLAMDGDRLVVDLDEGYARTLSGRGEGAPPIGALFANVFAVEGIESVEVTTGGSCDALARLLGDGSPTCIARTRAQVEDSLRG